MLARAPDNGTAWALLTETALQRGRVEAAIVCADRAVAFMPKDPIALILRAKCLFVSGEAAGALEAAEAASKMIGSAPKRWTHVARSSASWGYTKERRNLFLRAVAARPDVPQYLFNLAATQRMTGVLEEAEAHCDAAIALDRTYGLAHYLRSDLRIQTADRNHIAEMEALIDGGRLAPPNEVMLRFAAGKEYEDLDLHARAFDHVKAGCDLQHGLVTYDHAAEITEIDRIIQTHTRSWLACRPIRLFRRRPGVRRRTAAHRHDLGRRIFGSHPAMISAGETSAFAAEMRRAVKGAPSAGDPADIGRRTSIR